MSDTNGARVRLVLLALVIGAVTAVAWFALTARLGFDLDDEGFYWYGAQRAALGEVPLRDFASYDVGRYAYTALIFELLGDSDIMTLRKATHAVIALIIALMVFLVLDTTRRRDTARPGKPLLVGVAILFALLWTYPYYKAYDLAAGLVLLTTLYVLFIRRTSGMWFLLGLVVGMLAIVGRNHGLYGVTASLLACVALFVEVPADRPSSRSLILWIAGLCVGYAPVLAMLIVTPGFADAGVAWVVALAHAGATNVTIPVPWPWQVPIDIPRNGVVYTLHLLAMGCAFVLLILFPFVVIGRLARRRSFESTDALLAASLCVAIPHAHYAFSRADAIHLALGSLPLVVAGVAALAQLRVATRIVAIVVGVVFGVLVLFESPPFHYLMARNEQWMEIHVGPEVLRVEPSIARRWTRLEDIVHTLRPGERFLALPDMPSLHAAHHQAMAVHEIYRTSGAFSEGEQRTEIGLIEGAAPSLILLSDVAFDGLEARRFSRVRPSTYAWINRHYDRVPVGAPVDDGDGLEVYRRR